jgi:diguanylate cyclase (GGDEF)-like protein
MNAIFKYITSLYDHPILCRTFIKKRAADRLCLLLANKLQTSLEPDELLVIYQQEISKYLPVCQVKLYRQSIVSAEDKISGKFIYCQTLMFENKPFCHLHYDFFSKLTKGQALLLKTFSQMLIHPLNNAMIFQRMKKLAMTDNLTGLANRNQFDIDFNNSMTIGFNESIHFSLLILDLDGFKVVNDKFGHQVGDIVLRSFGNILLGCCRGNDRVFRIGGDEFTMLLTGADKNDISNIATRIREMINKNNQLSQFGISCSIGSASYQKNDKYKQLFTRADNALYRAKERGKNCLEMSPCIR